MERENIVTPKIWSYRLLATATALAVWYSHALHAGRPSLLCCTTMRSCSIGLRHFRTLEFCIHVVPPTFSYGSTPLMMYVVLPANRCIALYTYLFFYLIWNRTQSTQKVMKT